MAATLKRSSTCSIHLAGVWLRYDRAWETEAGLTALRWSICVLPCEISFVPCDSQDTSRRLENWQYLARPFYKTPKNPECFEFHQTCGLTFYILKQLTFNTWCIHNLTKHLGLFTKMFCFTKSELWWSYEPKKTPPPIYPQSVQISNPITAAG